MTADLHARAKSLFLEACRLPAAARASFLREACQGNAALLAEVESLLRFHPEDEREAPTREALTGEGLTGGTASPRSAMSTPGRFEAGTLYVDRYRIVERLGRGGMGEVYRAHDTLLDVPVALKLIHAPHRRNAAQAIHEVRLAREITHRTVCRVFDVGERAGEYYFTMEYVDGEHLGSLLRRVGPVSSAKVAEIGRQLCAGLAAAHAKGVLHRDLKPANIMIDSRGDVRITDFGIAVATADAASEGMLVGTPAYMAPELLRGMPASPQSDLYALGLILYELVTGRHPHDAEMAAPEERVPSRAVSTRLGPPRSEPPSRLVSDVDPRLERAILQAIEERPEDRPSSAIALSAALPGGDLLKAALEAGETPSPELVAAAGAKGELSPRVAVPLLVAIAIGLVIIATTAASVRLINRVPLDDPPAVLVAKARAFLREVTSEQTSPYQVSRLQSHRAYLEHVASARDARIDPGNVARLMYREGREPIVPALLLSGDPPFEVTIDNPPLRHPGSKAVVLDARGRLRAFHAVPDGTPARPFGDVDWAPFFHESGLDPRTVVPIAPARAPPPFGDRRSAWHARDPITNETVRIDAAASAAEPTSFTVTAPWASPRETPASADAGRAEGTSGSAATAGVAIASLLLVGSIVLAWRNVRLGRSDRRGAARLACVFFLFFLTASLLGQSFLPIEIEFLRLFVNVSLSLAAALLAGVFYLALEPFVRRRWPSSLISWNRLLAGRLRDPLVGRDVLIGAAASIVGTSIYNLIIALNPTIEADRPTAVAVPIYMGVRHLLARLLSGVPDALTSGLVLALIYTLFVIVVRRAWLAGACLLGLSTLLTLLQAEATAFELGISMAAQALFVFVFVRFGLVAFVSHLFFEKMLAELPLAIHSDWRSEFAIVTHGVMIAVVGLAAMTALRGTPPSRVSAR